MTLTNSRWYREDNPESLLKDMWTLIAAGFGKKKVKIRRPTILPNCKVHYRAVNNMLQEEPVDQSEHARDDLLALSIPTVSKDTHPNTSVTEVGLFSTTLPLTVNPSAPNSNLASPPHFQAIIYCLTLFHIMSKSQSLVLHANDYHAGNSTAAFGTL